MARIDGQTVMLWFFRTALLGWYAFMLLRPSVVHSAPPAVSDRHDLGLILRAWASYQREHPGSPNFPAEAIIPRLPRRFSAFTERGKIKALEEWKDAAGLLGSVIVPFLIYLAVARLIRQDLTVRQEREAVILLVVSGASFVVIPILGLILFPKTRAYVQDYVYVEPLPWSPESDSTRIAAYSRFLEAGERIVGFTDGSTVRMPDAEFLTRAQAEDLAVQATPGAGASAAQP